MKLYKYYIMIYMYIVCVLLSEERASRHNLCCAEELFSVASTHYERVQLLVCGLLYLVENCNCTTNLGRE